MKMESKRIILWQYVVFGLFIGISLLTTGYHERWADEVQAWLIAKEAGWPEIIAYIPHHEGQPVLWIALLKLLLYCFNTLDVLFLSTVIMAVTVWIILFRYDIPPVYKILIPFGQYFIYQYNVIARNYCLGYLALALTGLLYKDRHSHRFAYAASLLLLAESTTFYAPVAVVLGVAWFCEGWQITHGKIKPYLLPMSMLAFFGFVLVRLPVHFKIRRIYRLHQLYGLVRCICQRVVVTFKAELYAFLFSCFGKPYTLLCQLLFFAVCIFCGAFCAAPEP